MLVVFDFATSCKAAELYERYTQYQQALMELDVSQTLRETFLNILNQAYDEALAETEEALETASSPRVS